MNQLKKDLPMTAHAAYWINENDAEDKLQQGLTAYLVMKEAFQSIAARLHLIRKAQCTLDLQYYLWGNDFIGNFMLAELLKAADRGVQVRLLLDDQNGTRIDRQLKALMVHQNIQVKFYNPYRWRRFRLLDYLFRLKKINHRMHNKLIIADGVIAVTGGRNISSEYFDASEFFQFSDMDILFFAYAVKNANSVYQQFWDHPLSHPAHQIIRRSKPRDLLALRLKYIKLERNQNPVDDKVSAEQEELANELSQNHIQWAHAHFLADSPEKSLGNAQGDALISYQIQDHMGHPEVKMDLISAYFVPTESGTAYLTSFPKRDIQVRILTNSLVANDVALVHAFYQKYRLALLQGGVRLYEFKPYIERKRRTWYEVVTGNVIPKKGKNTSSLHAKFIDIDHQVFIGSFNLDPRSFNLNTEVGLVVESRQLQTQISALLDDTLLMVAYELKLDDQGQVIWLDHHADGTVVKYQHDPETTRFQRFMMQMVSCLPLEWMM
ncbi:phospholipase D family protein [Acinetobacter sp. WZC-1]|uniref:phospholipase D family protein n=1 Tax=Acinetobacter sp. WZC-1 TaxID=3459034 RepID=UPI00403D6619